MGNYLADVLRAVAPAAGRIVKVIVVDDERFWREATVAGLAQMPHLEIVAECATLAEASSAIAAQPFDLLIVDLGLPDGDGIDAIRLARRTRPAAAVLVATVFDDEDHVVPAICAGASGYILKDAAPGVWQAAVEDLDRGCAPISPKIARHILLALQQPARARRLMSQSPPPASTESAATSMLTAREVEVLQLVAKGFTLPEVAQLLSISATTARTHARNIYAKLEVNTRGEAIYEAGRLGLVR